MKRTDIELVEFLKEITEEVPRRGVLLSRVSDNLGVLTLHYSKPPHSIPYESQFTIYKKVDDVVDIFLELMVLEGQLICTSAVSDLALTIQLIEELRSL